MEEFKKLNPKIISVVDLTHLQPQERMHIIGNDNLKSRREFLIKLVKAGIVVGLPMLLLPGCEPEIIYKPTEEEDCPSHTGCSQNQPCACQADSTASIAPKVVRTVPAVNSSFDLDPNGVEIRIDVDKALDSTSINGALLLTPEPSGGYNIHFYDLSNSNSGVKTSLSLVSKSSNTKLQLLADTEYTVTLKGTVKDINGLHLDGNSDGTGGDDFYFSFKTVKKYDSCICQSDTCSCQSDLSCSGDSYCPSDYSSCPFHSCACEGNTCACQGHACTCVGFFCDCQFAGCPLYRV
jgi:hypothetical protein